MDHAETINTGYFFFYKHYNIINGISTDRDDWLSKENKNALTIIRKSLKKLHGKAKNKNKLVI